MKTFSTLLVVSFLAAAPSFAATFERLDEMTDPAIESFAKSAQKAEAFHNGDSIMGVTRVGYMLKNESESPINTIKQLVHRDLGSDPYAQPESLEVSAVRKSSPGYRTVVEAIFAEADQGSTEARGLKTKLVRLLQATGELGAAIDLYTVHDGNSFGRCSRAVVFDGHEMEILMVSSCWSE
jgi:hypothetical protein